MVDPRKDCAIVLEPHAQERRLDRGLPLVDLERMVRRGSWRPLPGGVTDVVHGKWKLRVKIGPCTISVATVLPER